MDMPVNKETRAMVRTNWMAALGIALAWAGVARAQETRLQPFAQPDGAYRIMTVQETGKPPVKCRVLADWRMPDGARGYKVQSVETGEILTIFESTSMAPMEGVSAHLPGSSAPVHIRAMTTRIYHEDRSPQAHAEGAAPSPYAAAGGAMQVGTAVEVVAGPGTVVQASRAVPTADRAVCCDECGPGSVGHPGSAPTEYVTSAPAAGPATRFQDRFRTFFTGKARPPAADTIVVVEPRPPVEAMPTTPASPAADVVVTTSAVPAAPAPQNMSFVEAKMPSGSGTPSCQTAEAAVTAPGGVARTPPPSAPAGDDMAKTVPARQAAGVARTAEMRPEVRPPSVVTEATSRPDRLLIAEQCDQRADAKHDPAHAADGPPSHRVRPVNTIASVVATQTGFAAPGAPVGQGLNGKAPRGARSVLAASEGAPPQVTYMPVPVVTVPDITRPPVPPEPRMPAVPQPVREVNAFTPPPLPPGSMPAQMAMMPPTLPAYPGVALPPQYAPNPYAAFPPNPYGAGAPGSAPFPYGGSVPAAPQHLMSQPNAPAVYQGPLPPNPVAPSPVTPVAFRPNSGASPAMNEQPAPAVVPGQAASPETVQQLVAILRDSLYPSQREIAACSLAACDWQNHPLALESLLVAVRQDPAPSVRVACVSGLGKMHVTSEYVLNVLLGLRNDSDPRVRHEVEQTLLKLSAATQPNGQHAERSGQAARQ
jgi:hypothetical protein